MFEKKDKKNLITKDSMLLLAIVLAVIYWAIESFMNIFLTPDANFFRHLIGTDIYNIYSRIIIYTQGDYALLYIHYSSVDTA